MCVWWNELVVRPRFEQVNDNTFRFWCGVEWEEMFNNSRKKNGETRRKKIERGKLKMSRCSMEKQINKTYIDSGPACYRWCFDKRWVHFNRAIISGVFFFCNQTLKCKLVSL